MSEKELLASELNTRFRRWRRINIWIDRVILSVLIFLAVFAGSGLIDGLLFLEEGIGGVKYHSFSQLLAINPATSVIYLTAYPNYALNAWKTGAKGFMLKPLDLREVTEQLERLRISLPQQNQEKEAEGR